MSKKISTLSLLQLTVLFLFSLPLFASASTTDGTIQAPNQYAWGENVGWVNFAAPNGNVQITDSGLTGYAWDAIYGWINLNPTTAGVKIDANGNLSGYAWSEGTGFINFSGVIINSSGKFTGETQPGPYGIINFDCSNCSVVTDYIPANARTGSGGGGGGGGGSGATPPGSSGWLFNPASSTSANPPVTIPGGVSTSTPVIVPPYIPTVPVIVSEPVTTGVITLPPPVQTIINGGGGLISTTTIIATTTIATNTPTTPIPKPIVKNPISPDGLTLFLDNLPTFQEVLNDLKLNTFGDTLKNIANVNLLLPNFLSGSLAFANLFGIHLSPPAGAVEQSLTPTTLDTESVNDLVQNMPLDQLPIEVRNALPAETLFAFGGNENIDLPINTETNANGQPENSIAIDQNNYLTLAVKPAAGETIDSITGYVVSAADASLATSSQSAQVLAELNYSDSNHDGLYSVNLNTSYVPADYQIITSLNYAGAAAPKVLQLNMTISPDGYVYEASGKNETRIRNATTTLYKLNEATNEYELWDAEDFSQKNPQITDQTGQYSFLVPAGTYYMKVEAKGYDTSISKPIAREEGDSLGENIELVPSGFSLDSFSFTNLTERFDMLTESFSFGKLWILLTPFILL